MRKSRIEPKQNQIGCLSFVLTIIKFESVLERGDIERCAQKYIIQELFISCVLFFLLLRARKRC